jgi:hypothetical protein
MEVCVAFVLLASISSLLVVLPGSCESEDVKQLEVGQKFKVEGKVSPPLSATEGWVSNVRILVDGGQYVGLLKPDGSFTLNIPSGSYVVEVTHPMFVFEPIRVEVNSKGKIRARSLNNIQPSAVHGVNYPLRLKARGQAQYFEKREQWRLTDMIFSPMIMMMFLPLALMLLLPKLINAQDPETQREMQQNMSMLQPQQSMPDPAEMLTKWLSGGSSEKKSGSKSKAVKKQ